MENKSENNLFNHSFSFLWSLSYVLSLIHGVLYNFSFVFSLSICTYAIINIVRCRDENSTLNYKYFDCLENVGCYNCSVSPVHIY